MIENRKNLDLSTATSEERIEAMNRGVRAALRRHKKAGVPAIVWNRETGEIVSVPPEEIPDYPPDPEADEALANPRGAINPPGIKDH